MRFVSIEAVEPGQRLGKSIFTGNGTTLLAENSQLTVPLINTLKRIGVTMIFIKDERFDDVVIEDVVSEKTKMAVISKMSETFYAVRSGKEFDTRSISVSVDRMLDELMANKHLLAQLNEIRSNDNEMYVHALHVCVMSVLIGINAGFSPAQLKDLAVGALLHDIGKVGREEDGPETSKEHHTWRGFELLKTKREYSLLISHICLQHHETIDGNGIPRRLNGDKIHAFAKIVAIANLYDNLISGFSHGKRFLPHEACERISALAGVTLEHEYVLHFLKTVSVYPTGTSVKLSTKETGVVVGQHRGLPGRPVVRVFKRNDNQYEAKEVDLARNPTVFIEAVL
ncbi:MAG TPA: HD domain-containing phosphohydrolase [Bacilli bacterium]